MSERHTPQHPPEWRAFCPACQWEGPIQQAIWDVKGHVKCPQCSAPLELKEFS